ncbi:VWA domain-containing protein [Thiomicrorhabdus sp.]|uniref:VWA domain-containing protein n=1 Tax=Thiomicrorhabdus sp. TaxID=2039724 RepID=UPI003563154A
MTTTIDDVDVVPTIGDASDFVSEEGLNGGNIDTVGSISSPSNDTTNDASATGSLAITGNGTYPLTVGLVEPSTNTVVGGTTISWSYDQNNEAVLIGNDGTQDVIRITLNGGSTTLDMSGSSVPTSVDYEVELLAPFVHPENSVEDTLSLSLDVSISDGANPADIGTLSITIEDDMPIISDDSVIVVPGMGSVSGDTDVSIGADGYGSVSFSGITTDSPVLNSNGDALYLNGEPLYWTVNAESTQLTAATDPVSGTPVTGFMVTLSSDGSYIVSNVSDGVFTTITDMQSFPAPDSLTAGNDTLYGISNIGSSSIDVLMTGRDGGTLDGGAVATVNNSTQGFAVGGGQSIDSEERLIFEFVDNLNVIGGSDYLASEPAGLNDALVSSFQFTINRVQGSETSEAAFTVVSYDQYGNQVGSESYSVVNGTQVTYSSDTPFARVEIQGTGSNTFTVLLDGIQVLEPSDQTLNLPVLATDSDGDSALGEINVNIDQTITEVTPQADTAPTSVDETQILTFNSVDSSITTNVIITLDVSGSMDGSRLSLAKEALATMVTAHGDNGGVNVKLVTFNSEGTASANWMSASDAISAINALTADGSTNYEDAVFETYNNYSEPAADQTVAYFISDGKPTSENYDGSNEGPSLLDAGYVNGWDNFVDTYVDELHVVALETSSSDYLDILASAGNISVEQVDDANDLGDVIVPADVTGAVSGNVLDNVSGGDGAISIDSIVVDGVTYTADGSNGTTQLPLSGVAIDGKGQLVFDFTTGDYTYSADANEFAGYETLSFGVNASDFDGDPTDFTVNIEVRDEVPVSIPEEQDLDLTGHTSVTTNVVITLDVSGSMDGSRLNLAKAALANMITAYEDNGGVNVKLVTFSSEGQASANWMSASDAISTINALTADGSTNYEDAVFETYSSYSEPVADQTVAYFISDGKPTSENPDGGSASSAGTYLDQDYLAGWDNFVDTYVDELHVVALETSASDYLNVLATAGNTTVQEVDDANDLSSVIVPSDVTGVVSGNVLDNVSGGDGTISIDSIVVDGVTYTSSNFPSVGMPIAGSGVLKFNFETGEYVYHAGSNDFDKDTLLQFTVNASDADGDATDFSVSINVDLESVPTAANEIAITADGSVSGNVLNNIDFGDDGKGVSGGITAVKFGDTTYNASDADASGNITVNNVIGGSLNFNFATGSYSLVGANAGTATLSVVATDGNGDWTDFDLLFTSTGLTALNYKESFDSDVSGWGSEVSQFDGKMLIQDDEHAQKTFNFGSEYAGQAVTVEFDLLVNDEWESTGSYKDYFDINVTDANRNDDRIEHDTYSGSSGDNGDHYSFDVVLDENGSFSLDLHANTTSSQEYATIDNFEVNGLVSVDSILYAEDGSDQFVIDDSVSQVEIKDFDVTEDVLDLSEVIDGNPQNSESLSDYLNMVVDNHEGTTTLNIDSDKDGNTDTQVVIDTVLDQNDTLQVQVDDNNIDYQNQ